MMLGLARYAIRRVKKPSPMYSSSVLSDRSNPKQSRADRIEELRKEAKRKMEAYEDLYTAKDKSKVPDPPADAGHVHLHHLDSPIPKRLKDIAETIESYILETWIKFFPNGSRLRKLQRDIAFRMDRPDRPGKLPYEDILPIIGKMEREGKLRLRIGKQGRMVIYQPTREQLETEKLKSKIESAVQKLEQVDPPTEGEMIPDDDLEFPKGSNKKRRSHPLDNDNDENFFDMFGEKKRG